MRPLRRAVLLPLLLAAACRALPVAAGDVVACLRPAPLEGRPDPRAPGYVVRYHDGVDAAAETSRLAQRHGFRPDVVYRTLPGFAAELSAAALAGVRCEASVKRVAHDGVATGG